MKNATWLKNKPVRSFFHNLGHSITNNCIDKVIAVSEDARLNYIKRQGVNPERVVAIPNSACIGTESSDNSAKIFAKHEFGF